MKFKHLLLASATGLLFANGTAFAQSVGNYGCFTDEMTQELEKQYPGQNANRQALERQIQQYISQNANNRQAGPILKVPVVVHVVTQNGLSGISKAQVLDGIDVLNRDFRRRNNDTTSIRPQFKKFSADLEVEFVMARKDPNGNPTEGIVRVTSLTTNGPVTRNDVKAAAPSWPTDKYFNVWLVQTINSAGAAGGGTILGYAQFPNTGTWNDYGLVMLHNQWGKQGAVPGSTATSDGRTATHEAGHCFNLYHTFQSGCGNSCDNSGDLVCDTPPAANPTYGCNLTWNTCPNDATGNSPYLTDGLDMLENYMSYDDCQRMFTHGQRVRAHAVLNGIPQLVNLTSANNAVFTGIDPSVVVGTLKPKAYFGAQNDRVCAGGSVTFTDMSYDGAATSYSWSFPGGTPSTSTAQNPTIVYSTPGTYDVTLTVSNSAGPTSYTATNQIKVISTANSPKAMAQQPYVEDFEDPLFPNNAIPARNIELRTFKVTPDPAGLTTFEKTSVVSTSGTSSIRLRNGSISAGTIHSLITPNIDLTGNSGAMFVSFDIAHAQRSSTASEEMKIFISNDCGATWNQRVVKSGTALATNGGAVVSSFTPSASQWRKENVLIAPNLVSTGKIMVKIEITSNNGNTTYIDNLRIYTLLGTNEEVALNNNIKLYPNPLTAETGISFDLKTPETVSVKIFDLAGKTVFQNAETKYNAGSHNLPLYSKMKDLKAGMYMVQVKFGDKVYNTKLIAQ